MRVRNIAIFSAAVLAGALGGSLVGPRPAEAVARELVELQHDVTSLLQGQKDLSTQMTQDHTVVKTLVEQSGETVGKLNGTMSALQKSMQDVTANSGARLDTMSTQVQGLSDNLEEIKSRLGKLNQQLVDLQNTVQSLDAKISGGGAGAAPTGASNSGGMSAQPASSSLPPSGAATAGGSAPSADTLYSTGSATSPAAITISPARNSRTTSSTTAIPTSPPTRSSILVKSPTSKNNISKPSLNSIRSLLTTLGVSSSNPRISAKVWPSSNSAKKHKASASSAM